MLLRLQLESVSSHSDPGVESIPPVSWMGRQYSDYTVQVLGLPSQVCQEFVPGICLDPSSKYPPRRQFCPSGIKEDN